MIREWVQFHLQQVLADHPLFFEGAHARATLQLDLVKRPWNEAQAIFSSV